MSLLPACIFVPNDSGFVRARESGFTHLTRHTLLSLLYLSLRAEGPGSPARSRERRGDGRVGAFRPFRACRARVARGVRRHDAGTRKRFFTQLYTELWDHTPMGHQDTRTLPLYNIMSGSVGLTGHT